MSKSPNNKNDFLEEKRKLLGWLSRWKEDDYTLENNNVDIKQMSMILQIMGFRLEKNFEKVLQTENSFNTTEESILKIELICPKSGLRSVLIKDITSCKCPTEEALDGGEFWSISGSVPSIRGSMNTSNSSLLPTVPVAKSQLIRCLLAKILSVIDELETNKIEQNSSSSMMSTSLSRHRSYDTLKTIETNYSALQGLKRSSSWEVDPKTSPPTQTSIPVPQLCSSLGQMSLNTDNSNMVIRNLESIKKLVDETLDIASGNNLTYTKNNIPTKRVSDIKPERSPVVKTPNASIKNLSTPRKMLTPKKKLLSLEKEKMAVPSRIPALKKYITTKNSTEMSSGTVKMPKVYPPSPNIIRRNVLKCGDMVKSKIAVKASGCTRNIPKAGTSGIQKPQDVKKVLGSTSPSLPQTKS